MAEANSELCNCDMDRCEKCHPENFDQDSTYVEPKTGDEEDEETCDNCGSLLEDGQCPDCEEEDDSDSDDDE